MEVEKYQPSSGTEGCMFAEQFCDQCLHEKWGHTQDDRDKKCNILNRAMVYDIKDADYPSEWIYVNDRPTCTAFELFEWVKDENGNLIDPIEPDAIDPNQIKLEL